MNPIGRFWGLLKSVDLVILASSLLIVAGTWTFLGLLDEVQEGDTYKTDEAILRAMSQSQVPAWVEEWVSI